MFRRRMFIEWLGWKLSSDDRALRRLDSLRGGYQTAAVTRVPVFVKGGMAQVR